MRLDTLKKTCQDVRKALLEEKKKSYQTEELGITATVPTTV